MSYLRRWIFDFFFLILNNDEERKASRAYVFLCFSIGVDIDIVTNLAKKKREKQ